MREFSKATLCTFFQRTINMLPGTGPGNNNIFPECLCLNPKINVLWERAKIWCFYSGKTPFDTINCWYNYLQLFLLGFFPVKTCTFCVLYLLFSKQTEAHFFLMCHVGNENSGGSKTNNTSFPSVLASVWNVWLLLQVCSETIVSFWILLLILLCVTTDNCSWYILTKMCLLLC